MGSVIERAQQEAERYYRSRGETPLTAGAVRNARTEAHIRGATSAAKVDVEQSEVGVEAMLREFRTSDLDGRALTRAMLHAALVDMGFEVRA